MIFCLLYPLDNEMFSNQNVVYHVFAIGRGGRV